MKTRMDTGWLFSAQHGRHHELRVLRLAQRNTGRLDKLDVRESPALTWLFVTAKKMVADSTNAFIRRPARGM
jgi:hypothetical protein